MKAAGDADHEEPGPVERDVEVVRRIRRGGHDDAGGIEDRAGRRDPRRDELVVPDASLIRPYGQVHASTEHHFRSCLLFEVGPGHRLVDALLGGDHRVQHRRPRALLEDFLRNGELDAARLEAHGNGGLRSAPVHPGRDAVAEPDAAPRIGEVQACLGRTGEVEAPDRDADVEVSVSGRLALEAPRLLHPLFAIAEVLGDIAADKRERAIRFAPAVGRSDPDGRPAAREDRLTEPELHLSRRTGGPELQLLRSHLHVIGGVPTAPGAAAVWPEGEVDLAHHRPDVEGRGVLWGGGLGRRRGRSRRTAAPCTDEHEYDKQRNPGGH